MKPRAISMILMLWVYFSWRGYRTRICPGPANGPERGSFGVEWQFSGTGLASDAGVAQIVERMLGDPVALHVLPHVASRPLRQRADLLERFAAGQFERLHMLEIRASRRLIATQSCKPGVVIFQSRRTEVRLSAACSSAIGSVWFRIPNCDFLVSDALLGLPRLNMIQLPVLRSACRDTRMRLGKVIAGLA